MNFVDGKQGLDFKRNLKEKIGKLPWGILAILVVFFGAQMMIEKNISRSASWTPSAMGQAAFISMELDAVLEVSPAPSQSPKPATVRVVKPTPKPTPRIAIKIDEAILKYTNAERHKAGLRLLKIDDGLNGFAGAHSTDMATNAFFSHTSTTYGAFEQRVSRFGIIVRAENIAMQPIQAGADEIGKFIVGEWMKSTGHRINIMNPAYTFMGIGASKNSMNWLITQVFK